MRISEDTTSALADRDEIERTLEESHQRAQRVAAQEPDDTESDCSPLSAVLEVLDEELDRLDKAETVLRDRLQRVLDRRPERTEDDEPFTEDRGGSELVERLREFALRVANCRVRLEEQLRRLEV